MSNDQHIAALKQKITETLSPLIDDDYSLLDAPNHNNIGDSLIYEGELAFLKALPFRLLFNGSIKFSPLSSVPRKGVILMHGGGNFGDLWPVFQNYRKSIIAERTSQRIIIFPQTVFYENLKNAEADIAVFSRHPDLIICARDHRSFAFLKRHFTKNQIFLLPDMAFCLDLKKYQQKSRGLNGLILKRTDKELQAGSIDTQKIVLPRHQNLNFITADWPGIEHEQLHAVLWKWKKRADKNLTRFLIWLNLANRDQRNFGIFQSFNSHKRLIDGVRFFNSYDVIITTRLHGLILALLLDKPVYILDNSYGKNSQFYDTWLTDFADCYSVARTNNP